jgi:hypothetical protein
MDRLTQLEQEIAALREECARLQAAQAGTPSLADCLRASGVDSSMDPYARAARAYTEEGVWELDDTTVVSQAEGGAYVLMWRWIPDNELEPVIA